MFDAMSDTYGPSHGYEEEEDKEGDGGGCDGRFKAGVQEFFEGGLPWVLRKSGRAN